MSDKELIKELAFEYIRRNPKELTEEEFVQLFVNTVDKISLIIEQHKPKKIDMWDIF